MNSLEGKKALVTGGSRGIGRGIVEALLAAGAKVSAVARDRERLASLAGPGVETFSADVTLEENARSILAEAKPDILVLSTAAEPKLGRIDEISWDDFSAAWQSDVKSSLFWIRHALRQPLAPGSRVILLSSGAAVRGSPFSGGYAGAKRMQWLMARYANTAAAELKLGIHFQALVPMQMIDTDHGVIASTYYAKKHGISREEFLARFGKPTTPREIGDHVVTMLTDPQHADTDVRAVKGDTGLAALDG